ncbi:thiol reductant ABC exporter subunit CydC [Alkalihalobacillus sp. MEB130]|uniref:thiol reductant ABC exporter subunit CydC n=1 Tax=Alkalihalobacillus sp. MEB130 TaxID=2976704 RepID=UPI0028DE7C0F|nr:thiol reductant ABC exporter subunit CydC [Alkalihalobacillus sp. MEB130]MDT8860870.1 thiol reductant ABC exporter subunit CydC [Alkalihalobacillus sp. MEB130]
MNELVHIVKNMMQQKKDVFVSIICGFVAGITAVGLFAANGYLISQAALEPPLYVLIAMVAVVKIGSFIRAVSRYAERYYSHRATFTMLSDLRVYFYEKLEKVGPALFQKYRSGDLLARFVGDVESLQNFFLRVLYPPVVMMMVFLSTMLFVSAFSIWVVLCLAVGLLLTGFVIPAWFAMKQKQVSSKVAEERSHVSTEMTEWLSGFRELLIHQLRQNKEQQLVNAADVYNKEQEKAGIQSISYQSLNTAVSLLVSWAVLAIASYLVATGQLEGIFLAMLVMISFIVFEHSVPMAAFPIHYEESERAAKRLYAVAETPAVNTSANWKETVDEAPSIECKRVNFTFPEEDRNMLTDVNLSIPAQAKVAIVGPSGSGKSTLLKLLLNQYSCKGELVVGGMSLNELEQEQLWETSKVILQENHFFYGTIKDNLLLSDDSWTDEMLTQLLQDVQLPHFSLSDEVMEKGQNLSGGEKQRLAMARAIAKKGRLWLLDEPTSSLDLWTENRLYELLFKKAKKDTVLLVSHRLAGLEKMNQIIVMDQGKVVESGTFSELMKAKGYFYELKQIENNVLQS